VDPRRHPGIGRSALNGFTPVDCAPRLAVLKRATRFPFASKYPCKQQCGAANPADKPAFLRDCQFLSQCLS